MFFVNYKLPQGADIHRTAADLAEVEEWLLARADVEAVTAFVGDGVARFMLTYSTQRPSPSHGHLIVRTDSIENIAELQEELEAFGQSRLVDGEFRTKRLLFGPGGGDPIQLRLSGPDPAVLRSLGAEAAERMQAASDAFEGMRTDWREQELVIVPRYATQRGQTAGVTRDEVADTLRFATDGVMAAVYRDAERLVPIIVRAPRSTDVGLIDQMSYSESAQALVPSGQVIDGFAYEFQDTLYHRRDRVPTLTVSADISRSATATEVHGEFREPVESMALPDGYRMAWGVSTKSRAKLRGRWPISCHSPS